MEFKVLGVPVRLSVALAAMALGFIICWLTVCRCVNVKEGLAPIDYQMGKDVSSSWINWADKKQEGAPTSAAALLAGNVAPNPNEQLEQGQLFMFGQNNFSPECCPSSYSGSTGCACFSPQQMDFLNERGGNRTMSTIY